MVWNPVQSLRNFAANQPPLLVFTVCLTSFGLTMFVLAYLVGQNEVPNPDISMDWNKFLSKVAALQICIPLHYVKDIGNTSELMANATHNSSFFNFVDQSKSMSAVLSNVVGESSSKDSDGEEDAIIEISVKVPMWISGNAKVLQAAPSVVMGSITGKQLGLKDKLSMQIINMSFSFDPQDNIDCRGWCRVLKDVCLTLQVASALLPQTKSPSKCSTQNRFPLSNGATVEFVNEEICRDGVLLHMDYTPNAELTEMLSIHERSIVNLHLMHTSYFMFVMVMTLLCYALIKGRYRSLKPPMEKVPLDA